MTFRIIASKKVEAFFAALLACGVTVFIFPVLSAHGRELASGNIVSSTHKVSPYHAVSAANSARAYYRSVWGVENLLVRRTASDNLIRFSYHVTDPARAKLLGDKRETPFMIGQRSRAVLQIPVMEKVGQLRQTGIPEAGKEYWMVFSNKGNLVKAGDRVNVVIGSFHADGLIVE